MNFYKLTLSTDPKIMGKRFPQVGIKNMLEYDMNSPNSIYRANRWGKVTSSLNIPDYILRYHAKRTDILSHMSQFLLISDRLKELIEISPLPDTQIFKAPVLARGKQYQYFLFHLPKNHYKFIDFARSTFALVPFGRPVTILSPEINTLEEFEEWIKEYPYLIKKNPKRQKVIVDKLIFDTDKIPYDMFRIIGPISGYFVSERLKSAIKEKGYTGMDFIPLEKVETVLPPA
ncbi:MAG TPA: hypothetical protein ENJ95_18360 [Bacteroidetes bacterium]|nr:hypothetical protein [Bacteroidota bacterium]